MNLKRSLSFERYVFVYPYDNEGLLSFEASFALLIFIK
jgi:hypothetical protein